MECLILPQPPKGTVGMRIGFFPKTGRYEANAIDDDGWGFMDFKRVEIPKGFVSAVQNEDGLWYWVKKRQG